MILRKNNEFIFYKQYSIHYTFSHDLTILMHIYGQEFAHLVSASNSPIIRKGLLALRFADSTLITIPLKILIMLML